jgi:hypothetical protein
MCEDCNPLGLSQPATSQAHGTVFVAIVVAVVILAFAGKLALSGVGPFRGEVSAVQPVDGGLSVSLTIHNAGTKAGSTTCRVTEASRNGTGPAAVVLSPLVAAGGSLTFSTTVAQFGASPQPLVVECQSP